MDVNSESFAQRSNVTDTAKPPVHLKAISDFALSPTCCGPSMLGSQLELAPRKRPCRGQQHHADQKSDHDIIGNGHGISITPQSQRNILM